MRRLDDDSATGVLAGWCDGPLSGRCVFVYDNLHQTSHIGAVSDACARRSELCDLLCLVVDPVERTLAQAKS
jgi:hypothetical protein